ncbi:MAG: FtsQ-type POTRA domain-containing protein [Candidatus Doudnabacteria bacterium]|nr:FtsQ-type POTRA domain-containing protein [Candidatus Doudnabacteria bacterium]
MWKIFRRKNSQSQRQLPKREIDPVLLRAMGRRGGLPIARRELQQGRRRLVLGQRLRDSAAWLRRRVKVWILLGVGGVVVVALAVGGYFLHQAQVYVVKEFEISGNQQTTQLALLSLLQDIEGNSLLLLNTGTVGERILEAFPYIKTVNVSKVLPGKIVIDIEERFPKLAWVDLTGVYLVDDEGVVVTILGQQEATALTAEQQLVYSGYGDPNAEYVKEKYLAEQADEAARKAVVWDEVPLELKQGSLARLREDLILTVNTARQPLVDLFRTSDFATLPLVLSIDAETKKLGEDVEMKKFAVVLAVSEYATQTSLVVQELAWESDFTLSLRTQSFRILFTSTKDIGEQLDNLEALITRVNLSGVTQIDLRSDVVGVK